MRNIPYARIFLVFIILLASSVDCQDESEGSHEDGLQVINLGRQRYFQGDVILPTSRNRNAILAAARWPQGIIYYTFGTKYPPKYQNMITKAIKTIEKNTCIQFRERVNEPDYVTIFNSSGGCYSQGVGRKGGEQSLSLMHGSKTTCFTHAIILHELLHVVGLWHEQMRYDRDEHITINWDNVWEEARGQFRIIPKSSSSNYNVPYDYRSVMHYDAYSFGAGKGKITMEPKDKSFLKVIGKAKDASKYDWEKVRLVYECGSKVTEKERSIDDDSEIKLETPAPCTDKVAYCKFNARQCANPMIWDYCRKTCSQC